MYRFRFLAVAALMLFSARVGLGQSPKTIHAFKIEPVTAIQKMDQLPKSKDSKFVPTEEEMKLLVAAQKGPAKEWSFAQASLMASGVKDRQTRKKYLARIDQLVEDARLALKDQASPFAKGEKLLQFLRDGPMKSYSYDQSSVAVILDKGEFNCVSSAVLYQIVARRLGLEVRGVMTPGHMLCRIYDGEKFASVETTNKEGFNHVVEYSDTREVGEPGSVAAIYNNTAAALNNEQSHRDAIVAFLCILALEPADAEAANCINANLVSWSAVLANAGQYREGLRVTAFGLELDPSNSLLEHNQMAIRAKLAQRP